MSQKPETIFRAKLRSALEKIPCSFWESIQQTGIRGTPDLFGCICGVFVALEIKTDVGVTSAIQLYKLNKIQEAGGVSFVVSPNNFEASIQFLENLAKAGLKNGQRSSIKKGSKRDKTKLQNS